MTQLVDNNVAIIGEAIDLKDGIAMVAHYRETYPNNVGSYLIGKEILLAILGQVGCEGIRFFNALEEPGKPTLVFLAVNGECRLLAPSSTIGASGDMVNALPIVGERIKPGGGGLQEDVNEGWGIPEKTGRLEAGEAISYQEGIRMVRDYLSAGHLSIVMSYTIGRKLLSDILNQAGCAGVKLYNALEQGMPTLVYAGVCADARLIGPSAIFGDKIKPSGGGLDVEIAEDWGLEYSEKA